MLQICAKFAETFSLTFNCKKLMCIKFGDNVNVNEIIKLNDSQIPWVKEIKHLGNYVNKTLSDKSDCQYNLPSSIGSVNKLIANFGNLQQDVIARLFKSCCCSFYGSQAWQINSIDYKPICVTWNKSVRKILKLPYTTHTWILGPLLDQSHIHYQLQVRTLRFISLMYNSRNVLITACVKSAINNANSLLGHNIAYFRNNYGINFSYGMCFNKMIHPPHLCEEKRMIIAQLKDLLLVKCGLYAIDSFTMSNIDALINPNVSGGGQKSTTPSNYQHRIFLFNYIIVRFR